MTYVGKIPQKTEIDKNTVHGGTEAGNALHVYDLFNTKDNWSILICENPKFEESDGKIMEKGTSAVTKAEDFADGLEEMLKENRQRDN